jgi:hypothetical protein
MRGGKAWESNSFSASSELQTNNLNAEDNAQTLPTGSCGSPDFRKVQGQPVPIGAKPFTWLR